MKAEPSPANPNDKRRAANINNSQRSTGPKTEAGKQASSLNAFKYGLFSPKPLLPGESEAELAEFEAAVLQDLAPRNAFESHLIKLYLPLAWRLRGLPAMEAFAFLRYGISEQGKQCGPEFALVASMQGDNILDKLSRFEATKRKAAFKILELLRGLRKDRWEQAGKPVIEAEVMPAAAPCPAPTSLEPAAAEAGSDPAAAAKPEVVPGEGDDYEI